MFDIMGGLFGALLGGVFRLAPEVLKFFDYAFTYGAKPAVDLDYVPLPQALTDRIRSQVWSTVKK